MAPEASRTSQALGSWIVVTGLDGAGKTTLVQHLGQHFGAQTFRLPFHGFVRPYLDRSGYGLPFGDAHTDRLLFALDARLANYEIRLWRTDSNAVLISQRGWMDNFIFGAVQGVPYNATDALLKTAELERPSAHIFLIAEPSIAFARIKADPKADKFETSGFLIRQHEETLRFLDGLHKRARQLAAFFDIPIKIIDTGARTADNVFELACDFLSQLAIRKQPLKPPQNGAPEADSRC